MALPGLIDPSLSVATVPQVEDCVPNTAIQPVDYRRDRCSMNRVITIGSCASAQYRGRTGHPVYGTTGLHYVALIGKPHRDRPFLDTGGGLSPPESSGDHG
jgi:hypothetical protein